MSAANPPTAADPTLHLTRWTVTSGSNTQSRGAVVTRERLMDEVWDTNWYGSTKTLDVTVGRLRQKLDERDCPSRVVTVRGVGFRLEDGPADA